jgi:DNA mismatch repair protein MutL
MGKIRRLPEDLANQIAAGEVVERPASVVKELVENALDAGATRVHVDIELGGVQLVRVADDGEGMTEEDARLCLERHATSKIGSVEDLTRIRSFGFRGEALPSIASVARFALRTRTRQQTAGVEVRVEGGGPCRVQPAGCAPGTTVEVRELFYNVPARRKFLKATGTESAHVGEIVMLSALARPDVTFVLARDGRPSREYLRVGSRSERAAQVLDGERLATCASDRGPLRVEAFLAPPERARAGAVALHLLVNGRPVRDRQLARAVAQAYGSVLEPGRYPVGVVYIDLPSELVDVNVHPQKAEVRFADARAVHDAVARELHGSLGKAFGVPAMGPRPWAARAGAAPSGSTWDTSPAPSPTSSSTPAPGSRSTSRPSGSTPSTAAVAADPSLPLFAHRGFYANLRFVAQTKATYLLCEGDDGIYVLDQHAAAERVTYHRLREAFEAREVAAQRLLLPEIVELLPQEIAALEEHAGDVARLGMEVRAVGPSAVAVHAVPQILVRASPERLVRDLLAELSRVGSRGFGAARDLVLATMACHGSIRAGDAISAREAEALLRGLDQVDFSGHCPHGRPVVTRIGFDELERRVGRA